MHLDKYFYNIILPYFIKYYYIKNAKYNYLDDK